MFYFFHQAHCFFISFLYCIETSLKVHCVFEEPVCIRQFIDWGFRNGRADRALFQFHRGHLLRQIGQNDQCDCWRILPICLIQPKSASTTSFIWIKEGSSLRNDYPSYVGLKARQECIVDSFAHDPFSPFTTTDELLLSFLIKGVCAKPIICIVFM